jgi:hypothetical protein
VLRDIVYHLGPGMVPLSLHVHLTVGDAHMGSGWMRHGPATGTLECESHSPSLGRIAQVVQAGDAFDAFGTHPVVGDGYLARAMDISRGPHRRLMRVFLPSPDHRGAKPPLIAEVKFNLDYVGEEERTVPARSFHCRHGRQDPPGLRHLGDRRRRLRPGLRQHRRLHDEPVRTGGTGARTPLRLSPLSVSAPLSAQCRRR